MDVRESCFQPEALAEIAELSAGDPRRAHLEGCARCRARLAAFASFMAEEPVPAGADPVDAEARLSAVLDDLIGRPGDDRSTGFAPVTRLPVRRERQPMRLVLALAAVLVVAVGLRVATQVGDGGQPTTVLRGDKDPVAAAFQPSSTPLSEGIVQLAWQPVPGAEGYRVVLIGADLRETAQHEVGSQTRLDLGPDDLADAAFWRVIALRGGDPVARSAAQPLNVP